MSQKTSVGWVESLKRFALGRPVLFSIVVLGLSSLLVEIPFDVLLLPLVGERAATLWKVTLGHTLTGGLLFWLLIKLGLFGDARFTPPRQWKAVWLVWPLLVFVGLNLESLIDGSLVIDTSQPGLIVLFVFLNLAIGFCEEVMARGLVLSVMLRKWGHTRRGVYRAVLVAGLLFGLAHIGNLITGHLSLTANLSQIIYSVAFGVLFAACFLRVNSIWPTILLHAAIDFTGGLRHIAVGGEVQRAVANSTVSEALISGLIVGLPVLVYGLFILRKVEPTTLPA